MIIFNCEFLKNTGPKKKYKALKICSQTLILKFEEFFKQLKMLFSIFLIKSGKMSEICASKLEFRLIY